MNTYPSSLLFELDLVIFELELVAVLEAAHPMTLRAWPREPDTNSTHL
jgi:hypothetical protein